MSRHVIQAPLDDVTGGVDASENEIREIYVELVLIQEILLRVGMVSGPDSGPGSGSELGLHDFCEVAVVNRVPGGGL